MTCHGIRFWALVLLVMFAGILDGLARLAMDQVERPSRLRLAAERRVIAR